MWETHYFRSTQCHLLVVFLILSLELHVFDTVLDFGDGSLHFLDGWAPSFSLHLARFVLFVVLLFQVLGDLQSAFEFARLHLFLSFRSKFFVILLEFLLDFLALLFDQESLVLFDPLLIDVFIQLEKCGTLLLL